MSATAPAHRTRAACVLRAVAELFAIPGAWTQNAWARNAQGMPLTRALDDDAVCWCLRGAIRKLTGAGDTARAIEDAALDAVRSVLRREPGGAAIATWNDDTRRTVDDVIRVVSRAAIAPEARP